MESKLEIKDLVVSVDGKKILNGLNLVLQSSQVNVIMGPNGSGKSTLAFTLMGHPKYVVESGKILFNGQDITHMKVQERAKLGLFLSFQYPAEVSGVKVSNFLRTALNAKTGGSIRIPDFQKIMDEKMNLLKIPKEFATRYLNEGFSGGEKKKTEILQMAVLEPKLAILDETDSGTDVDALKVIAEGISTISKNLGTGILLITHYNRILHYIKPDFVHVMVNGKIVITGKKDLADKIEKEGYEQWLEKGAIASNSN